MIRGAKIGGGGEKKDLSLPSVADRGEKRVLRRSSGGGGKKEKKEKKEMGACLATSAFSKAGQFQRQEGGKKEKSTARPDPAKEKKKAPRALLPSARSHGEKKGKVSLRLPHCSERQGKRKRKRSASCRSLCYVRGRGGKKGGSERCAKQEPKEEGRARRTSCPLPYIVCHPRKEKEGDHIQKVKSSPKKKKRASRASLHCTRKKKLHSPNNTAVSQRKRREKEFRFGSHVSPSGGSKKKLTLNIGKRQKEGEKKKTTTTSRSNIL